jgi:hypothetical protein
LLLIICSWLPLHYWDCQLEWAALEGCKDTSVICFFLTSMLHEPTNYRKTTRRRWFPPRTAVFYSLGTTLVSQRSLYKLCLDHWYFLVGALHALSQTWVI